MVVWLSRVHYYECVAYEPSIRSWDNWKPFRSFSRDFTELLRVLHLFFTLNSRQLDRDNTAVIPLRRRAESHQ